LRPAFEIDEGFAAPDVLLQFRARHDVAGPLDQHRQHARRLRLQPRRHTVLAQLAGLHVEFDLREP
jgi:hypothetical protein